MNIKFKTAGGPIILYAAALFTVGVIMVLLNCFFVEIKPRFTLPMMEFLLLSIMILLSLIFVDARAFRGDRAHRICR
jgi:hypothetical protein